jgi:hypothetical protein
MTGDIISFEDHRDFKRRQLQQIAPWRAWVSETRDKQILEPQLARIAELLNELQELSSSSGSFPPTTLVRACAEIERARRIIRPLSEPEHRTHLTQDSESDPQPEIDRDKLDRMYGLSVARGRERGRDDMLDKPRLRVRKQPVRYLLRAVHPDAGKALDGNYHTMKAALNRGVALMRDGYYIEIWSPAFLEGRGFRNRTVQRPPDSEALAAT